MIKTVRVYVCECVCRCIGVLSTDLDGVKDKLLAAVLAGLCTFGTLGHAVLG